MVPLGHIIHIPGKFHPSDARVFKEVLLLHDAQAKVYCVDSLHDYAYNAACREDRAVQVLTQGVPMTPPG